MPITPFKIVKDDGTIDKEEYLRCIKFLEDYTSGRVKVYTGTTWVNPLEINEDSIRSSYEIIYDEIFNNLLTLHYTSYFFLLCAATC